MYEFSSPVRLNRKIEHELKRVRFPFLIDETAKDTIGWYSVYIVIQQLLKSVLVVIISRRVSDA
jgi:hypothetical protein